MDWGFITHHLVSAKGFKNMMLAHCIFMTGWAVAAFLPLLAMKESYIAQYCKDKAES